LAETTDLEKESIPQKTYSNQGKSKMNTIRSNEGASRIKRVKMSKKIDGDRRGFFGTAVATVAAAQFGVNPAPAV
jgi:hypothetical protein